MSNFKDLINYLTKKNIPFKLIEGDIQLTLKIASNKGRRTSFDLIISEVNNQLKVKEIGDILPEFCPNRHINPDGSFCLGILDDWIAENWIKSLREFLQAQLFCNDHKKWSKNYKQWSHGDAATYQLYVEELLKTINLKDLGLNLNSLQLFNVESRLFEENYFHIYHEDKLIFMGTEKKIHCKRQSCICTPSGRRKHVTLGKCSKKCAEIILKILINEELRKKEEVVFWDTFKGSTLKCCKTMENCELNA